jgi:hypothetical protein
MADSLRPSSVTRLHLLDDGGLLFNEQSQALYAFNATAAFVWCCIEDGLERDDVLATIEQNYGVARAEAEKQLDPLFLEWEELARISQTRRCIGALDRR